MNYHVNDRTPERELDARIATEVMGWQVRWVEVNYHRRGTWLELRCKKAISGWFKCPWFAHDVGDAWLVVEKMRELEFTGHLESYPKDEVDNETYCMSFIHTWTGRGSGVWDSKAPIAVCVGALEAIKDLAALKAVGGEQT